MKRRAILSTDSAVLNIYLQSENCAMEISNERQFLIIEQQEERVISEIELQLMDNLDHSEIINVTVPSRFEGSLQRVRIDALFPLIFQDGEGIRCSELEDPALFTIPAESKEYSLNITVQLGSGVKPTPTISIIYSGWILVESAMVCVSKELLGVSSEYFTSFFYGAYLETISEVKEIKEVSETDFVQFMSLIHNRKFILPSVRMALVYLGFADYFGMMAIMAKTVPYLLRNSLPESLLNEGLKMADRIPNNTGLLEWVLKNIPNNDKLFNVLHDTIPMISKETTQICLKRLHQKCKVTPTTFKDEASLMASMADKVGIDLRRYSYSNKHLDSIFFSISISRPTLSTIRIAMDDIWPYVPRLVNKISYLDGGKQTFTRGSGKTIDIDNVKVGIFWYR